MWRVAGKKIGGIFYIAAKCQVQIFHLALRSAFGRVPSFLAYVHTYVHTHLTHLFLKSLEHWVILAAAQSAAKIAPLYFALQHRIQSGVGSR